MTAKTIRKANLGRMITVRVTPHQREILEYRAIQNDESLSEFVRRMLVEEVNAQPLRTK
jgi:predicted HicB family RNase H-like nuclease